jgi:hypothetical protein
MPCTANSSRESFGCHAGTERIYAVTLGGVKASWRREFRRSHMDGGPALQGLLFECAEQG